MEYLGTLEVTLTPIEVRGNPTSACDDSAAGPARPLWVADTSRSAAPAPPEHAN